MKLLDFGVPLWYYCVVSYLLLEPLFNPYSTCYCSRN